MNEPVVSVSDGVASMPVDVWMNYAQKANEYYNAMLELEKTLAEAIEAYVEDVCPNEPYGNVLRWREVLGGEFEKNSVIVTDALVEELLDGFMDEWYTDEGAREAIIEILGKHLGKAPTQDLKPS